MDPIVIVAIIGLPANMVLAVATYRKAKSADNAVNHRVGGTTVSEDIADMRHEVREMHRDLVWLSREQSRHLREDHGHGHQG